MTKQQLIRKKGWRDSLKMRVLTEEEIHGILGAGLPANPQEDEPERC